MLLTVHSSMRFMYNFVGHSAFFVSLIYAHKSEDNNFCETSVPSDFNLAVW